MRYAITLRRGGKRQVYDAQYASRDDAVFGVGAKLTELEPGTPVIVTMDDGTEWATKTRSYRPWQLGHGTWIVALEGKHKDYCGAGGYDLSRVRRPGA